MTTIISLIIWPLALGGFIIAGGLLLISIFLIPRDRLHPLVRIFCRFILLCSGQILIIKRETDDIGPGPYIYMFNHASLFDVFIVGAIVRHYITAVAAIYQFSYPIWGTLIRRYGIIPILRTDIRKAIASLDKAEDAIKKGDSFLISPEGTRTLDGNLRVFKKGGFHVALHTGATIIPMAFGGTFRAKRKTDWRIRPGVLRAYVGQPITATDYQGMSVKELCELTRDRIQNLIQDNC